MKISLSIYNSILFGELRPWLDSNRTQEVFRQKLNPAFRWEKGTPEDFEKALNEALKDHPLLMDDDEVLIEIEENKIIISSVKDKIFEPLIDIDIPPFFTDKTEYYYYLIKNEGTRLINKINKAIELCETANLAKSAINDTLDRIKYLLSETAKQIKQLGYDDDLPFDAIPDDETKALKKECDYILQVLQTTLIRLILEIQELFPSQIVGSPLTEEEIYLKLIGSPSPIMNVAKKITKLNEFIVKRFIEKMEYSRVKALQRIDETKKHYLMYKDVASTLTDAASRKEGLATHIQILENLIFIRDFTDIQQNPSFEELQSDKTTEEYYNSFTATIFEKIEEPSAPNKRLEQISKEEEKFAFLNTSYNIDNAVYKLSIPRKILKWLEIQKAYINENLHIDFSKLKGVDLPKIQTSLTVAEIGYLLRTLEEEGILQPKNKTDLSRVFSAVLSSKKKDDITFDGLHKEFKTPKNKAVEFWDAKFMVLKQKAYKDKEKYLD